ncbi:MAG TPA: hypothetical protein P5277_03850 [Candidatus Paceibacterota bacterium]|nr:hypothetical protein [Candidatus Paceibacterota bacterium]
MKKETISYISIFIILSSLVIPIVSAQYFGGGLGYIDLGEGMRQIIDQTIRFLTPVFEIILGDYQGSEFFFTKILLLILLVVVIYTILKNIPLFSTNPTIAAIVAIAISTIGVRFISDNQIIQGILLPYGTLGIALTTLLPCLIFFYFIYSAGLGGAGRKICWAFFGITLFVLWIYKSSEISDMGNWIYIASFITIGIVVIFDKRINYYFQGMEGKRAMQAVIDEKIAVLQTKRDQMIANSGPTPSREQKSTINKYQQEIRRLEARKRHFV